MEPRSLDPRFRAGLSGENFAGGKRRGSTPIFWSWAGLTRLDRAIYVPATRPGDAGNRVDARVKPAHDGLRLAWLSTRQPISVPRKALRESGAPGRRGSTGPPSAPALAGARSYRLRGLLKRVPDG